MYNVIFTDSVGVVHEYLFSTHDEAEQFEADMIRASFKDFLSVSINYISEEEELNNV